MSTMIQRSAKASSLLNSVDSFKIECSTLDQDLKINSLMLNGKLVFTSGNRAIEEDKANLVNNAKKLLLRYGIALKDKKKYSLVFEKSVLQLVDENRLYIYQMPNFQYIRAFDNIVESCKSINDRLHVEKISKITAKDKIKQIDSKPNTVAWKTAALVSVLIVGFFALSIGIGSFYGSFLPSIGAHVNASLGIVGMPSWATFGALGLGIASLTGYLILRLHLAKKSKQMNEYFKDIHVKNRQWFLPSNMNDFSNGILLILTALTAVTTLVLLKGCLAYPAGILMLGSGFLQIKESINAFRNASKVKDSKEIAMSILKLIYSGVVIGLGLCTLTGFMSYTFPFYFLVGGISIILAVNGLISATKQKNEIDKVDENDPAQIMNYLEKNLSLSKEKRNELKAKIYNYKDEDVQKWLKEKAKKFSEEKIAFFKQAISLEEKQKMILNEEIQIAIEKKMQNYASIVRKETLKEAIEFVNKHNINFNDEKIKEDLKKLFAKIKEEIITKIKVELIKIFALYIPFTMAPALELAFRGIALFEKIYYLVIGSLTLVNFTTNLDPKRRNIPPTDENKDTNINQRLISQDEKIVKTKADPSEAAVAS